jgi:peptidoglycan/xylan/chitin deacetylase (PgdA/CDA1 family)
VVGQVFDGAIVELHLDASTSVVSTAVALPWIIGDLRARGYRFVTIPQMTRPCR